jgi:branched-chain amino acid transport system permease protein
MQQTINGLSVGSVYALLGLSVTLIWGVLQILTFAQAQILVWGAFGSLLALNRGYSVPVAVIVGIAVGGLLSVLIDVTVLAALRRRKASEYAFVVATIGVALVLSAVLKWRTESQYQGFPRQGFPRGAFDLFGQNIPTLQLTVLSTSVAVMLALGFWLNRTRSGRAMRAVAFSRDTSELLGINSRLVYAAAFFVSGGLAALAGIFISVSTANIAYSSGDPLLLIAFAVIILGGMGSVRGAVVGGLLLGLIEVYATVYVSSVFRQSVAFLMILLVLLVRPSGLFGEREATRV